MRRALLLLPLAALVAACGGEPTALPPTSPAPPQVAELDWDERYPTSGPGLRYTVDSFEVTRTGWRARVGVENTTGVTWELGANQLDVGRIFGIALFRTDDISEVEELDRLGELPLRAAETFRPALPETLGPDESWAGVIEGPGRLPGGLWVRVVIGPLVTKEQPPGGIGKVAIWFTDHAYRLRTGVGTV